ncbi:ankyrin repeat and protein kinase domain-containing protein 1 [Salvelinus sp. IW2-2015]|uniref:ankyrin repeat and protein kinase domain-containing protein 1 n=1 Tax=Salvelinus sp. IW2-2015 TaxID=2691554 RepID=UPI0038D4204D
MDRVEGGLEKFRVFKKDDFEADWIKVTERSFGQVYRVKLKLWREKCALKSFNTTLTGTSLYRRMIEEASKMEKVTFKYIVSVYGVCNDPPSMVMEYMSNGSLDRLLTSHVLMWPKKFQMIHEVTMGMNFLHSMNPPLLHLNLKPSNILLDDHLHIKISDFGLIKWEEAGNKKEFIENLTARGNIFYIPPETFTLCSGHPGTKFDVYSFSIVMWEILTQKRPYQAGKRSSTTTVLMKVSSGRRPGLEKIPDDKPEECEQMITIMQQCWDQDPRERPDFSDKHNTFFALFEDITVPPTWPATKDCGFSFSIANCEEVRALKVWCQENNLSLNFNKTKKMIVDFRKQQREYPPVQNGQDSSGEGGKFLRDTYGARCHRKAKKIIKVNNHPSHCLFTPLSSRRRG